VELCGRGRFFLGSTKFEALLQTADVTELSGHDFVDKISIFKTAIAIAVDKWGWRQLRGFFVRDERT
jgi:hypothetical protein